MVFSQPSGKNKESLFGSSDKRNPTPTFRLKPKDTPPPSMPTADDLIDTARVVSLPMRTKFRGITVREALLFKGPAGWGEFAPFPE
ncbi:MAG: O-succinylbenzoate synthase, partial [Gordonia sp. (in: high G+C Gram-positive bacteria)]|nr:O-succinylbenzoate synthase [Gordonia sp. (in: high G+C Gram-positive bacteria)]